MNKVYVFFVVFLLYISGSTAIAQSYAIGLKGGPVMAIQRWQGTDRAPLFAYHGRLGIEGAEEDDQYNLYAEVGYHERGSALKNRTYQVPNNPNIFQLPTTKYLFQNVSLSLGAKSKKRIHPQALGYYGFAIRGEYTVHTNLQKFQELVNNTSYSGVPFFPIEEFVERWNYGIDITGGLEYEFTEYVNGIVELRLSPDFSPQYAQPPLNYTSSTGGNVTSSQQKVYNFSLELSVGFRFLRKIVYID